MVGEKDEGERPKRNLFCLMSSGRETWVHIKHNISITREWYANPSETERLQVKGKESLVLCFSCKKKETTIRQNNTVWSSCLLLLKAWYVCMCLSLLFCYHWVINSKWFDYFVAGDRKRELCQLSLQSNAREEPFIHPIKCLTVFGSFFISIEWNNSRQDQEG